MRGTKAWTTGLLVTTMAMVSAGSVGCVSQAEVDRYQTLYRQSQEQVTDLRMELEEAEARIAALQEREPDPANLDALNERIAALEAERDEIAAALDAAERQLRETASPLEIPAELSDRLADLAAEHPDLMTYDPDLGMVQLQSDLTFDLGSADVRENAVASLEQLARVLNSSEAQQFEIRVVGHTDSVPIQRPETLERHPTNWHLSAHRAIAVRDVLDGAGIDADRFNVAGYGPYRPVVEEEAGQGAEENRRVEIYLMPMTEREERQRDRAGARGGGQSQAPQQARQAQQRADDDPAQYK